MITSEHWPSTVGSISSLAAWCTAMNLICSRTSMWLIHKRGIDITGTSAAHGKVVIRASPHAVQSSTFGAMNSMHSSHIHSQVVPCVFFWIYTVRYTTENCVENVCFWDTHPDISRCRPRRQPGTLRQCSCDHIHRHILHHHLSSALLKMVDKDRDVVGWLPNSLCSRMNRPSKHAELEAKFDKPGAVLDPLGSPRRGGPAKLFRPAYWKVGPIASHVLHEDHVWCHHPLYHGLDLEQALLTRTVLEDIPR